MLDKKTIGSQDFYGSQTPHKKRQRSGGQAVIDENHNPLKRHNNANHKHKKGTQNDSDLGSAQKMYSFPSHCLISHKEMNHMNNGFSRKFRNDCRNPKRLNGGNSRVERHDTLVSERHESMRMDMKTLMANSCQDNSLKTPQTKSPEITHNQKITHYFQKSVNNESLIPLSEEKTSERNDVIFDDWWVDDDVPNSDVIEVFDANCPFGLKNLGNTCYMNSVLQCLFALKFFINDLETSFEQMNPKSDFSMTESLLNLYNQYNSLRTNEDNWSGEDLETSLWRLKDCVGQKSSLFQTSGQQDAAEFFTHVIDTIAEEFETSCNKNLIWDHFGYEMTRSLECKTCGNETKIDNEKFHALGLTLPDDHSLTTGLRDFLKDETTGHQCVSENCSANENVLRKSFTKHSKALFLQLGRYTEDGSKRTESVAVPQVIHLSAQHVRTPSSPKLQDMSRVVRKISFDDEEVDNEVVYQLVAVICHHGISLSVGHYTSFVFNSDNNQWYSCDDNRISKTDFDWVEKSSQKSGYCFIYTNKLTKSENVSNY